MEWYTYMAIIGIGFLAGFINTLAGGGSALSVPLLIFMGLPANVANGTNRIAILLQNAVATWSFAKEKVLDVKTSLPLSLASVAGAALGAAIAINLNEFIMRRAIGVVLILVLATVIIKPGVWLRPDSGRIKDHGWFGYVVFFFIGAYGGFIQIGTGFFLLAGLVFSKGLDLVKANAVKVFIILVYTPLALAIFFYHGQVNLKMGLILAVGNMLGALTGSKVAVRWGPAFIRWVLIIALGISAAKLFGVF
ncbi:MAG: sulfite exporter TauE/SafE family protein [Bacteroidales bacterium]|jgi:uncharacterized membrane protein YfcA